MSSLFINWEQPNGWGFCGRIWLATVLMLLVFAEVGMAQEEAPQEYVIEIEEIGAAPQQRLAYHVDKGRQYTTRIEYRQNWDNTFEDLELDPSFGGTLDDENFQGDPHDFPPYSILFETRIVGVAGEAIRLEREIIGHELDLQTLESDPEMFEKIGANVWKTNLARAAGLKEDYVIDLQGRTIERRGIDPADLRKLWMVQKSLLASFDPVLPDDPVGVGARWSVYTQLDPCCGEFAYRSRTNFNLTSIEGNLLQLAVDVLLAPPGLEMNFPIYDLQGNQVKETQETEFLNFTGKGVGRITLDLTKPEPIQSQVELNIKSRIRAEAGAIQAVLVSTAHFAASQSLLEKPGIDSVDPLSEQ